MKGFLGRFLVWFSMISAASVIYMVITDNLDVLPWALLGGFVGSVILAAVARK